MIKVETTQGPVVIDVPYHYDKIGVKISGGADSAIMTYMLALYKKQVRNISLIPVTVINAIKPHQHIFSRRVLDFIENELNVRFESHQILQDLVDPNEYNEAQRLFIKELRSKRIIQAHFTGITENPDIELDPTGNFTGDSTRDKSLGYKNTSCNKSFFPFENINKKAIAELYDHYGIMDSLFPLTRSCENSKIHFTEPHCGKCWWCLERKWGFGRLE